MNDQIVTRKVKHFTISVDRNLCIGAATCVALAPKAWKLDEQAKAELLDTAAEDTDQSLIDSAKGCPVAAITIIDDDTGKQIFP